MENNTLNIELALTVDGQMSAQDLLTEVIGQLTYCELTFDDKASKFRKMVKDIFALVHAGLKDDSIRGVVTCGRAIEDYLKDEKRTQKNGIKFKIDIYALKGAKYG